MEEIENFTLTAKDGTSLYGREWLIENPKAAICLVHGLGEHIGRYEHVAEFFNSHQISFFAFDLRGHGRSEGKRGHTPSHYMLVDDVEELLMFARAEYNDVPLFLYGHSLGGNIATNYVLKKNINELTGAIISSPWLALALEPPAFQMKLAKFVSGFLPSLTQSNGLDVKHLTNDDAINQAYKKDPLVHDKISTKLFTECYREGLWALENSQKNKIPLLIFHGTEDRITSPDASKTFAENIGELATYHQWPGIKHEPHNDVKKEEVLETIFKWVKEQV
ncbi:Lysophospholipase, alpha-beta hydrolase superfamily [Reichenbachiella faecimaris]|uniref:Monoacylglycerol lipase n=1 Tax=Reichenbachiella faecimaris TaxID=692418 RepID=A0A1W2GC69_REIFA|nr:alpha/beta hydrolase [Reichenbachiella faecimaris]SMD34255.1 Lysophospholipase, alpha-beta hydrolase superfamily [Reichenbachiella faecimaris]